MGDDFKREGVQQVGDEPRSSGQSQGWSSRWSGQPAARTIQVPHVAARRVGNLTATIEDEVIPRLLLSQRAHIHEIHTDVTPLSHAGEECIDEFVQLLLTDDLEVAYAYIDAVRVRGVTLSGGATWNCWLRRRECSAKCGKTTGSASRT